VMLVRWGLHSSSELRLSCNYFHSNGTFSSVDKRPPMATIASGRPSHFLTISIDIVTKSLGQHLQTRSKMPFCKTFQTNYFVEENVHSNKILMNRLGA
jgi:hypothetical protein